MNSSRVRLLQEIKTFAKLIPDGSLVLDAGAGDAPYKKLFHHVHYETADFEKLNKNHSTSTYVCDLQSIPVKAHRFDFILLSQVLEHLPEPELVLVELNRILKPNGKIFCSCPLFYEEHQQPFDFYRYTKFGLMHLFSKVGFVIEQLDWLEGYYGTVGYQLESMARYLPLRPQDIGPRAIGYILFPVMLLCKAIFGLGGICFHRIELLFKIKKRGYPKNYFLVARKAA